MINLGAEHSAPKISQQSVPTWKISLGMNTPGLNSGARTGSALNGEWQFEIDQGDSGLERGLLERALNQKIRVPFCPESKLSGIDQQDFLNAVWYRKTITIPAQWKGRQVLLHFQAVDYDTTVWVNGIEVKRHRGGFSSFSCDLSNVASAGDTITLVVRVRDRNDVPQPRGKQTRDFQGQGALYGRTTGIWQTVWMEPVPEVSLKRPRITPDVANRMIILEQPITHQKKGFRLRATVKDVEGDIVTKEVAAGQDFTPKVLLPIPEERLRLWSIEEPHLYDVEISLLDMVGNTIDHAQSYAGMRSVTIEDKAIKINDQVIFQRLVLDQGYYPDGLMTAPSDEALRQDIILSMEAGLMEPACIKKSLKNVFFTMPISWAIWSGESLAIGDHEASGRLIITKSFLRPILLNG
jgi:beta-galactosidase/beta-glucuronidase